METYLIAPTLVYIIAQVQPTENYNFGVQSHVRVERLDERRQPKRSPSAWRPESIYQMMSTPSAPCASSMPNARGLQNHVRLQGIDYDSCSPSSKTKIPHFTRATRVALQNCMHSGSPILKPVYIFMYLFNLSLNFIH